jgi:hypothetical protein
LRDAETQRQIREQHVQTCVRRARVINAGTADNGTCVVASATRSKSTKQHDTTVSPATLGQKLGGPKRDTGVVDDRFLHRTP